MRNDFINSIKSIDKTSTNNQDQPKDHPNDFQFIKQVSYDSIKNINIIQNNIIQEIDIQSHQNQIQSFNQDLNKVHEQTKSEVLKIENINQTSEDESEDTMQT